MLLCTWDKRHYTQPIKCRRFGDGKCIDLGGAWEWAPGWHPGVLTFIRKGRSGPDGDSPAHGLPRAVDDPTVPQADLKELHLPHGRPLTAAPQPQPAATLPA